MSNFTQNKLNFHHSPQKSASGISVVGGDNV